MLIHAVPSPCPAVLSVARPSGVARRLGLLAAGLLLGGSSLAQMTERVSVDSSGNQSTSYSDLPSISRDGRYVVFQSFAANLVPGDTNGATDIFMRDRHAGATVRVSVDSSGSQGNAVSSYAAIAGDGGCVAFGSQASNLIPGDTNASEDVFVHDLGSGATERVSVDSSGNQGNGYSGVPAISGDGRHVAFYSSASNLVASDTNGWGDVFVHDRQTGATQRVSVSSSGNQGNGECGDLAISEDGRYVAFYSEASNLVPGDTNGRGDVFVRDVQAGSTTRVSVDSSGIQGNSDSGAPSISSSGRYVSYWSFATNLVAGDTKPDLRRLRARSPDGRDGARQRRLRREPGQRRVQRAIDLR